MLRRIAVWLLIGVGMNLVMSKTALAADYYVATTGNDGNSGSSQSPWKSISYGINKLRAGDRLLIRGGTYNVGGGGSSPLYMYAETAASGTAQAPITVKPESSGVVIDGNYVVQKFLGIKHDYWIIEGLELKNFIAEAMNIWADHNIVRGMKIHHIYIDPTYYSGTTIGIKIGIHYDNPDYPSCDDNLLENNEVYDISLGEGIYVSKGGASYTHHCRNNKVIGNTIYNVWEGVDTKLNAVGTLIQGNTISDCGHFGIGSPDANVIDGNRIYECGRNYTQAAIYVRRLTKVTNNLIYGNPYSGIRLDAGKLDGWPADTVVGYGNEIYHNTVVGNRTGILFADFKNLKNNRIIDNISAFNTDEQINNRSLSGSNVMDYNDWYGGPGTSHALDGPNTLHVDPGFVDRAVNDFRLVSDSLVRDEGTAVGVSLDFEGNSRDSKPDMGAYEYVSMSPMATPTVNPNEMIIDNVDEGFSTAFVQDMWQEYVDPQGLHYGSSHMFNHLIRGGDTATWSFTVNRPGEYEVYASWWPSMIRPTDVPYTINFTGGAEEVRVNQQVSNEQWNLLGKYYFINQGSVTVSDMVSGGEDVVADAIRLVYQEPGWRFLLSNWLGSAGDGSEDGVVNSWDWGKVISGLL